MEKPTPTVTPESEPYWEGCIAGELRYQLCEACQRAQFPPALFCRKCRGGVEWRVSEGQATIFSLTEVHRAPNESFRNDTPYMLALVDLDEGFRIMTNIVGEGKQHAQIGARVSIVFEARGSLSLPQARLQDV